MKRQALIYYILVLCSKVTLACDPIAIVDDEASFEKLIYKATITDNIIDIIDGPIRLSTCDSNNLEFQISANETKYQVLFASYSRHDCTIAFYGLMRENITTKDTLYDVLTLEAYIDGYVAKTSIIILNSSEYDPYKLVYSVNGTEYVILNYAYFKIFLLLIVAIGILILVLEIREIVLKYKGNMYAQLDDQINYI